MKLYVVKFGKFRKSYNVSIPEQILQYDNVHGTFKWNEINFPRIGGHDFSFKICTLFILI